MKKLLVFLPLLILVIFISGCTTQVQEDITGEVTETTVLEKKITEETTLTVQPKLEETVTTEVTSPVEPEETREPKTYQVNVVQGIGVKEST